MVEIETLLVAALAGAIGAAIYVIVREIAGPPLRRLSQKLTPYPLRPPREFGSGGALFHPQSMDFLLLLQNRPSKPVRIDKILLRADYGRWRSTVSNPLSLNIFRESAAGDRAVKGEWWQLREDNVIPPYSFVMFGVGDNPDLMASRIKEARRLHFVAIGGDGEVVWKHSSGTAGLRRSIRDYLQGYPGLFPRERREGENDTQ